MPNPDGNDKNLLKQDLPMNPIGRVLVPMGRGTAIPYIYSRCLSPIKLNFYGGENLAEDTDPQTNRGQGADDWR